MSIAALVPEDQSLLASFAEQASLIALYLIIVGGEAMVDFVAVNEV